jgi:DNA-binding GntR family transcriptional regulator
MIPKYKQIISELKKEIKNKKYTVGERFYSESDIRSMFQVSSTTAVKVLNSLADENLITRIQGKGTFIAAEKHNADIKFTDLNMSKGRLEATKVLSVKEITDTKALKKLGLPTNRKYIEIVRLRYIGSQLSELTIAVVDSAYIKNGKNKDIQIFADLYHKIENDSGINPFKLAYDQKATAIISSDSEILNIFNTKKSLPLIKQARTTYIDNNKEKILEKVRSYKLLKFWGFKIEVPATN